MKLFKNLFSKKVESDYQVVSYFGTKLKWLPILDSKFYTKKEADRISFYMKRIHPNQIFKSQFGI